VGVPEQDVFGKQDGAVCNRDLGMPEEEVVGKQDGAVCNRTLGVPEENVVRKNMPRWGYVVDGRRIGNREDS